jgi:hypothetical protein
MKTRLRLLPIALVSLVTISCGNKKEKEEKAEKGSFFPVLSFIQAQVAHVDTALFSIRQFTIIDSTHIDTMHIPREQFRGLAKDFLELPDLSEKKYEQRFTEKKVYDETLNRLILVYEPIEKENEIIQRQELVVTPDLAGGDSSRVNSIIVNYLFSSKDSSVQKRMLWQADRSFQITTIKQLPGKPETMSTTRVTWNEPENQ